MHSEETSTTDEQAGGDAPGGALVTGVGGAWGLEIAQALAARGHAVHLTDLDGTLASRAAAKLGAPAFASALDVRSLAACRAAAARTRRRTGSLEIWVNNASVFRDGPAWELDERTRQRMLEVNMAGAINGTLAALEGMRADERGSVVNVVAMDALLPEPGFAMNSAAGHGIIAFSLSAHQELRQAGLGSVSVVCLCPAGRSGGSRQLASALDHLLENPRPMLAVPQWRGRLLRACHLWPALGKVGSRIARLGARSG